jgi:hypothetical protein
MILMPLLSLIAWTIAFKRHGRDWLDSAVASLTIFGLTVALGTELQSLAGILVPFGSVLVWTLAAGLGLLYSRRAVPPVTTSATESGNPSRVELLIGLMPIVVFLGLTAAVALISAPNSYDGLSYHLTRVETWIQRGSVLPYPTHDTMQAFMPSWPEYAILQLRLLSGGDRFANLVQWIAFAGACGGAALLTRSLGGGRIAGLVSAALVATLPMAVAQASGTQTDLIAAAWAVIACVFAYRLVNTSMPWGNVLLSAVALGLAAATKQTAVLFGAFALFPALMLAWRSDRRLVAGWVAGAFLAVAVVAGPHLARTRAVFGNFRGDPALIETVVMTTKAPGQIAINMARNLTLHFGTPWFPVNRAVVSTVARASQSIGVHPSDPRTTWGTPFGLVPWNTHEEAAPNPLHLLLILGCLFALIRPGPGGATRIMFVGALVAGFVVFSASLKWQFYGSRLHTPLFVLALGWVAIELERAPWAVRRVVVLLLMLAALPGALLNYTRPLLSLHKGLVTPRQSILAVPRNVHYFLYMPELGRPYREVALRIADSGCDRVGVRAYVWEYAVRALVRNAGSEVRFHNVDVQNVTAGLNAPADEPCLLLHIGRNSGSLPRWAANWRPLVDHSSLGVRGIALFAPHVAKQ